MKKILSLCAVVVMTTPLAFAASGDSVTGATNTGAMMVIPSNTPTTTPTTVQPTVGQASSLGEYKSISCATNPAFGANSCDQCFDGGSVTAGKRLTGLFDNWTNNTNGLMIAYQGEQKNPNMIPFGNTKWSSSPSDESKVWINSSDIIWTPTQSGSTKLQYILGAGQKVKFYEADLGAGYTLDKTDRKNGELVGMMKYPVVFHTVDASGNEGAATSHVECVAYNLSAPVVAPVAPVKKAEPAVVTPEITKTATGPAETIILIVAAFFIAFGLMFSLRKRI